MNTELILTTTIGVLQVLATGLIAWIVYSQTQKLKRFEHGRQVIEAYSVLNTAAVSSDANLLTFDRIGREDVDEDMETRRKRWCAFLWLESLQVTFLSRKNKLIDRAFAEQALRQQLELIMRDDLVHWLVCNRGFDPEFAAYCTSIRNRLVANGAVDRSPVDRSVKAGPAGSPGPPTTI